MAYYGINNNVLYIAGTSTTQATTSFTPPTTVSSSGWPWTSSITSVTSVVIQNALTVSNTAYMFYRGAAISSIEGLSYLNTSSATSMFRMFYNCRKLSNLDVSSFNTSNVTDMGGMFYRCPFTSIDLSNFNTSNVTNMSYMFAACASLISLDLSNFNTTNVTDMSAMFYGCSALTSLDLSSFNTSGVTTMLSMFDSCSTLTSLDLSNFNTSSVTDMYMMFHNCTNLTILYLNNFVTNYVEDFSEMFLDCSSLTTIYCKNTWTGVSTSTSDNMFSNCTSLKGQIVYDANKVDKTYASLAGYFTVPPIRHESGIVNNLLPKATDTDGSIYNNKGYKENTYMNTSSPTTLNGYSLTGFIPFTLGDTIYLKNVGFSKNDSTNRISFFDSNKSFLGFTQGNATYFTITVWGSTVDDNNFYIIMKPTASTTNGTATGSAYFRLSATYLGPDSIITVNNPINIVDDSDLEVDSFKVNQESEYIKLGNSVPLSWYSFNTVDSYVIERNVNEGDYEVVYTGTPYTSTGYSTNDSPSETGIVQYRAKVVKGNLSSEYVYSNPYIVYAVSTYENLIVGGVL